MSWKAEREAEGGARLSLGGRSLNKLLRFLGGGARGRRKDVWVEEEGKMGSWRYVQGRRKMLPMCCKYLLLTVESKRADILIVPDQDLGPADLEEDAPLLLLQQKEHTRKYP